MRFIWPKLPTAEYISSSENRIYREHLSVRQAVTDRRKGAGLMGKLTEAAAFYAKFAGKVLPEAYRQRNSAREELRRCSPAFIVRGGAMEEDDLSGRFTSKESCCFLFSMCPGADYKDLVSFILSLHNTAETLEAYRKRMDMRDEKEVRDLLGCLSAAVDPSRSIACSMADTSMNQPTAQQKNKPAPICHAERCRLKLAVLPSYTHVSAKIKKYMQMYIDLQSYRHYPPVISRELLKTWSSGHLRRFQEISCWELCAAADTFLGIAAMFAAASVPDISDEEVLLLDEVCFPWLSGFFSMLDAMISARTSLDPEELNFSSFYRNLKECEERLIFFAEKTEAACRKLKDSSLYLLIMRVAAGLFLSDPEATFGMLRLTVSNIIRKGSLRLYSNAGFLLRAFRLI
jgi:tetraprenyl-beta-curcumene synthase